MINLTQLSTENLRADFQNYKNILAKNKQNSSLIHDGLQVAHTLLNSC